MFDRIYIEEAVQNHPRTLEILKRYDRAERIDCGRYSEVFNPKRQSFRLQKQNPALILAAKHGNRVLPTPPEYGLGADQHYYFSHMLNCLYDCRYCFLQGMYQSANYVLFVNYEDFVNEIKATLDEDPSKQCFFFSGYDCDSLAMDKVTGFTNIFLPFFAQHKNAWLELRTKSVNISSLLEREPIPNVVAAYSLNPEPVADSLEHRAPLIKTRLSALKKLAEAGWEIGLRFDPLIHFENGIEKYSQFIDQVFDSVPPVYIHSVTLGTFRSPKNVLKKMESLYPKEPLFMGNLQLKNGAIGYEEAIEQALFSSVEEKILQYIPPFKYFPCQQDA